jgi:outer membrane protein assembly factor BamB
VRCLLLACLSLTGCSNASSAPADAPKPAAAERPGSDWPRFLGPTGDNASAETGILTAWPREGLRKVWDCKLGQGYAPPTVAAGKLYHADQVGNDTRITCRDAATGAVAWTYSYETKYEDNYGYEPGPRCCPVVDGDRVYVYGAEGMLLCLSADAGKEIWKVDTRAKYKFEQNFFGVGSAPVVEGELLIVAVGGSPPGPRPADFRDVKPNGTAIVAFDKKTGAVKYQTGDELASYASPIVATVNGKRLGLYFARGGLLGFDPASGRIDFHYKWRAKSEESVNAANPVVVGDRVLISECFGVGAACVKVKPGAAEEVWTDRDKDRDEKALMCHWNTPVHHDGYVYGSSGRHAPEGDLRCVELATGEVKWAVRRTTRCTLLKVDGHVLSLGEGGELRLFKINPAKYEEVARWESPDLDYPAWAPPVLSRGLLYVRGKDKLVCYELRK